MRNFKQSNFLNVSPKVPPNMRIDLCHAGSELRHLFYKNQKRRGGQLCKLLRLSLRSCTFFVNAMQKALKSEDFKAFVMKKALLRRSIFSPWRPWTSAQVHKSTPVPGIEFDEATDSAQKLEKVHRIEHLPLGTWSVYGHGPEDSGLF